MVSNKDDFVFLAKCEFLFNKVCRVTYFILQVIFWSDGPLLLSLPYHVCMAALAAGKARQSSRRGTRVDVTSLVVLP